MAQRLGNGIPLSFIFSLGANKLLVGMRLLAPRVVPLSIRRYWHQGKKMEFLYFFFFPFSWFIEYIIGTTLPKNLSYGVQNLQACLQHCRKKVLLTNFSSMLKFVFERQPNFLIFLKINIPLKKVCHTESLCLKKKNSKKR